MMATLAFNELITLDILFEYHFWISFCDYIWRWCHQSNFLMRISNHILLYFFNTNEGNKHKKCLFSSWWNSVVIHAFCQVTYCPVIFCQVLSHREEDASQSSNVQMFRWFQRFSGKLWCPITFCTKLLSVLDSIIGKFFRYKILKFYKKRTPF